jgi:hypothetical protein
LIPFILSQSISLKHSFI